MSFLSNIYYKSLAENERHIRFWEEYLNNLKALDFNIYQEKLKIPALIPIGSRVFFRGEIKHTNEVIAALGAGYFAKCSLVQAEILRQHRIKDAQSKLDEFLKEKKYLENQLSYSNKSVFDDQGKEIIEICTEEEDKAWRETHRKNMRQYKQSQSRKNEEFENANITDEEIWNRLEELELQEELENELNRNEEFSDKGSNDSFIVKEEDTIDLQKHKKLEMNTFDHHRAENCKNVDIQHDHNSMRYENHNKYNTAEATRLALLEKVLNKQNELEDKLFKLRNKERSKVKTEEDLISKLDEIEQLEELEDEMERIEDIIETEEVLTEEEVPEKCKTNLNRKVSFANEEDSEAETLEITFKHSNVEPCIEPYDPKKGIIKPSDIYQAFPHLFTTERTSILKKSKYKDSNPIAFSVDKETVEKIEVTEMPNRTIIVNDVVDRSVTKNVPEVKKEGNKTQSLFKKQRQQMKSKN